MAKRFTATEMWAEDWFLDMPIEYKLFWYYMLANCDHAGLFKVNLKSFCGLNSVKIDANEALKFFNSDKQRIRQISDSMWLIEEFFMYQYGTTLNLNSKVHSSIAAIYQKHKIDLKSIKGILDLKERVCIEVKERVKDKDKDKDIEKVEIEKKEEGGVGEEEKGERENFENKNFYGLYQKMMTTFTQTFVTYFKEDSKDYPACNVIARKIETIKGWHYGACMNGKQGEFLEEWDKMVKRAATNSWLSKMSLKELSDREWQKWCTSMANMENGTDSKELRKAKTEKVEQKSVNLQSLLSRYD